MMINVVIGTMLIAGIVGGLINSYLSDPNTEKPLSWWQHIIVGVGAAFMVPVFLNMISSRLISEIKGETIDSELLAKLLVLAGFCLLAAVSSRAFIRSMTDRLLQEVSAAKKEAQEAKNQAANAEAIASISVEPAENEVASQEISTPQSDSISINATEKKILEAMVGSRFSMRSISGLAKDAGLDKTEVNSTISLLLGRGLIAEGKNSDGQLRWYPTAAGRKAISSA